MKFLVALAVLVAAAAADVAHLEPAQLSFVPIVKSEYEHSPDGGYHFGYEGGNGIYAQAQGVVKDVNSEYPAVEVKGDYGYTSPEGQKIQLSYIANENGYQPQGDHLPQAPPVPELIARALRYLAEHPQQVVEQTYKAKAN